MVKGEETSPDGRIVKLIWERGDDGKLITEIKKFYFTGMTIQEKDEHFRLIADRESKSYALNRIGEKLKMIAKKSQPLHQKRNQYLMIEHGLMLQCNTIKQTRITICLLSKHTSVQHRKK